jgi:trk system potassium uptake protein TrkH
MLTGAMAGSTCGGMKMSRIVIFFKGIVMKIKKIINPRYVAKMQLEGEILEEDTVNDVFAFIAIYILLIIGVVFILCFDPACKNFSHPFLTNFTASISCVSNIGPGLASVGPYASFAEYSYFSKIILTLTMLTGRLEIFPVLILFSKKTWQKM